MGFPDSSAGKESACNAGDPSLIPGSGRSTGEGIGYPLQYSWASLVAQLVRICLQCGRPGFGPWVGKIPWRRERLPTPVFWTGEFHGLYSSWGRKDSDMIEGWLASYDSFKNSNGNEIYTTLTLISFVCSLYITPKKKKISIYRKHTIKANNFFFPFSHITY